MMRRRGPGLIRTAARTAVVAGTATAVSGRVMRRQQQRAYEEDSAMAANQQPIEYVTAPAPSGTTPEYIAELERLSQLKVGGIISEEEFQAKKRQLLGI